MQDFITYAEWHVPHLNLALGANFTCKKLRMWHFTFISLNYFRFIKDVLDSS